MEAALRPRLACLRRDLSKGLPAEPPKLAAPYPAPEQRRMGAAQLAPLVVPRQQAALREAVALREAARQGVARASAAAQQRQTD